VSLSARAEIKLTPRTTHKATKILVFIKWSVFTHFCEHVRGQSLVAIGGKAALCLRVNVFWGCPRTIGNLTLKESSSFASRYWRMSK
jgi:hypothetical protein